MSATVQAKFVLVIDRERCKGCGLCIDFCPADVLAFSKQLNSMGYHPVEAIRPEACTGCQSCVAMCPDVCIEIYTTSGAGGRSERGSGHGAASEAD